MPLVDVALRYRRALSVLLHVGFMVASSSAAIWLRFDGEEIPAYNWDAWVAVLPWLLALRSATFVPFRLYEGLWRYTSIWDLRNILVGVILSTVATFVVAHYVLAETGYPRSVFIIDALLLICLMSGARLSRRVFRDLRIGYPAARRVLIVGAGDAGEMIVRDMRQNTAYEVRPVGFVDDDPRKVGLRIHGVAVLGRCADLQRLVEERHANEVLLAIPSASPGLVRRLIRELDPQRVRITTLPSMREIVNGQVRVNQIRAVAIEDLLTRAPVGLNVEPVRGLIEGRRVLVTGAGGSIGSELTRQIAALRPSELVVLDRYENSLFHVLNNVADAHLGQVVHGVVADVTDHRRLDDVFGTHRPQIVFHAAAHKHVPLMEVNPCEAVKNNVRGFRIVAESAQAHGAERFVFISTDKAVNPTSVMGATKRVGELMLRELADQNTTRFITVRFGNVLGSNGSVVPRFLDQIQKGGPVTVTHPEMRRYFMLIPEAVQLVLHAAAMGDNGQAYVLDMGEPVRLVDMAHDLIRLSGYVPDEDIAISFVGARPGEKLTEELIGPDESAEPSPVDKIRLLRPTAARPMNGGLMRAIADLEEAAVQGDSARVYQQLGAIVPTSCLAAEVAVV